MSTNGETADLMVREGIQITESALKLAGLGAKNLAALLIALANDNQKLAGKTNLKRLIQAEAGKAHRVSVIMPSLYGGRQHRRVVRESLDCAVALQELQTMGVRNIITFDAHDPRVQNAVPLMSFDNAMPTYQVLKSLLKKDPTLSFDKEKFTVVSPDEGAMNRNMYFSSVLGCNLGMFYKRRDYTRIVNGRNPIVAHEYMGKEVNGKDVCVADDILSSGESMMNRLRSGMSLEITNKCLVFYKIILQHLSQILVLYFLNISKQFLIHAICTLLRCRHIIGGDIFTLLCFTDLLNVKLQIVIIADDFTIYFNKIHLIIICDSAGIRIPYFPVKCPGLILKDQIIIWSSVSGLRRTLSFAQIYISDCFSFVKGVDISHLISSFYILY